MDVHTHVEQYVCVCVRACVCFVNQLARACTYRLLLYPSLGFRV
jgi:hypothetical protein